MKRIPSEIEKQKNISWNDARNLFFDGRAILFSNITELLRSAVVKKEPNIPGWQSFDSVLPWQTFLVIIKKKNLERLVARRRFREPCKILRQKSGF